MEDQSSHTNDARYTAVETSPSTDQQAVRLPIQGTGFYQESTNSSESANAEGALDEIVVTGTNIRGIAPDSSPTFIFDRETIEQAGFLSTEQFIRSIPQVFGGGVNSASARGLPNDLESSSSFSNATGVNLRGLGAGATLTLLNGRRLAAAGSAGAVTDVSAIPLSAIYRIETLTDGASSIYGGDAVSGVINFVLRDDFDGAETRISYGGVTEGDLDQIRASQTIGASWGSGNALASYEFFDQGALLASEKEFAREAPLSETLLPEQRRHSAIAAFSQSITDSIAFKANGFFADRNSFSANNSDDVLQLRTSNTQQFLLTSSLEYEFLNDWRLAFGGDYGETVIDVDRETSFTSSNAPPETRKSRNKASQTSADIVVDGTLFELPSGPLKLAIGAAYRNEEFVQSDAARPRLNVNGDRQVWAAFGELFLPLVGEKNRLPGVERLEINASVRRDDYSDFGSSTNPKFGLLWSPLAGLNFRGTYSTSFNPPDIGTALDTQTRAVANFATNPTNPAVRDVPYLAIGPGAVPDLTSENSRAFTAGLDYEFDFGPGQAIFSSTYYNINFEDRVDRIPRPRGFRRNSDLAITLDRWPDEVVTLNPSLNEVQALINFTSSTGGDVLIADGIDLSSIDFVIDRRTRNLFSTKTQGVDFNVSYDIDTSLGALNASLNANYIIDLIRQPFQSAAPIETLNRTFNPVDLRMRGGLGWRRDGWKASAFVNYTDDYFDTRTIPSTPVTAWTTVDVNIKYDFGVDAHASVLNNMRVSLSALNVFDQDPPALLNDANGFGFTPASFDSANAEPLGRFISISISKQL